MLIILLLFDEQRFFIKMEAEGKVTFFLIIKILKISSPFQSKACSNEAAAKIEARLKEFLSHRDQGVRAIIG